MGANNEGLANNQAPLPTRAEASAVTAKLEILSSLPYFAVPAALMGITLYVVEPWLVASGIPPYYASSLCLYLPLGILGAAALLLAKREAGKSIASRLRLFPLERTDLAWTAFLTLAMIIPFALVDMVTRPILASMPWLMPRYIPEAFRTGVIDWTVSAGASIQGNWLLAATACITFIFNIVGEELWWRGYVLPRQEAGIGKHAWIAHGLMWALFHAPKYWAIPALIPGALAAAYVASRRKSTSVVLIAHAVTNSIGLISLLASVLSK